MSEQPADHPFELQNAERGHDLGGRQAGAEDQLVDADGMVFEMAEQRSSSFAYSKNT